MKNTIINIIFSKRTKYRAIRVTALTLVFLICISSLVSASAGNVSPFADVTSSHWAFDEIMEAYGDGAVGGTGYADNGLRIFDPNGKVTMAQFIAILTRAFYPESVEMSDETEFWYSPNYDVGSFVGLFDGVPNTAPDTEVTREVMAQIMYNLMMKNGVAKLSSRNFETAKSLINDFDSVSTSYREAVLTCYYWSVINGINAEGDFAPKGRMNRAQTAVIYARLKNTINKLGNGESNPPTTSTPSTGNNSVQTPSQNETQTPAASGTLTNGQPVTEENVLALMEEYKNGKMPGTKAQTAGFTSYADNATYDAQNPSYYSVSLGRSGIECAKFAFSFSDDLFGDAPMREITNPEDVRPGDLLQFPGHWAIATKSAFTTGSGNLCTMTVGGGTTGQIGWGNVYNAIGNGRLVAAYTRYPG